MSKSQPSLADVEEALARAYVGGETRFLRKEDRQKAREITALLHELLRVRSHARVVDACAGKATVGVMFAHFVSGVELTVIEREPKLVERARAGAAALGVKCALVEGDVAAAPWPQEPDIVIAMHACGAASDAVIDRVIASKAKRAFVVPCCYGSKQDLRADALGLPRHAPVRVRFSRAMIDAERTLKLEAAGYETEVVELVASTVTPFNLLWRAKRVCEPVRMQEAKRRAALVTSWR